MVISFDFACWFGTKGALGVCFGADLIALPIGAVRPERAKIVDLLEAPAVQVPSIVNRPNRVGIIADKIVQATKLP